MQDLERLRRELSELDVELLERVARRQQIVAEIGRVKSAAGRGTRDYARERDVLELARSTAARVGLDQDIGEALFRLLIRASLAAQEQDKVALEGSGSGRRVLVVGGCGNMGRWFSRFLDSQEWQVELCDPRPGEDAYGRCERLADSALDQELLLLCTPTEVTLELMRELAGRRPPGVVCDISSAKQYLQPGYQALRGAGCAVASIHPLFGPDTELLSGRNLILVDVGDEAANALVRSLFQPTMVECLEMGLEDHDKAMAYVLGLSHAVNIAFFGALAQSGQDAGQLARLSSDTFDAQLEIASRVSRENPYLYYEIQTLNSHSPRALVALLNATSQLAGRVLDGDQPGFVELMQQGKAFLEGRPEDRP